MADIGRLWQLLKGAASNEASKYGNSPRLADLLMRDRSTQGIRDYAGNVQQRGATLAGLLQGREPTDAQKALFSGLDPTTDEGAMNFAMTFAGPMAKTANLTKLKIAEQVKAKTKYEIAHELAQRNASLPIEQGGLGLPAGNTAMDRAKAMGFDTPAYHTTDADILAFENNRLGSNTLTNTDSQWSQNLAKKGHWLSNKDLSLPYGDSPGMYTNVTYPVLIPTPSRSYKNLDAVERGRSFPNVSKVSDEEFKGTTSYIVPNPSNIRSLFAAFDPMRRNSTDLLAGVAPLAVPSVLASLLYQGKQNND